MSDSRRIDRIEGTAIPLRGDNIDTDRIIPARFLKSITFDGLGDHVFEDDRRTLEDHPFSNPVFRDASILLVNVNFGSGSSREHAPRALKRWGIRATVGESFSEIFLGNAVAIGLPCAAVARDGVEFLMRAAERAPDTRMALSVADLAIRCADRTIPIGMPPAVRESLLNGVWDPTGLLLDRYEEVRLTAGRLPYVQGF